jgi:MFS family permease
VTLREYIVENIAGDLEYHPRRGAIYLGLAGVALCFWCFSPSDDKFTILPLVVVLGALALLLKGIFLLRKSSEGLGLSYHDLARLSDPSNRKPLPSIATQASQIIQDFGTGGLLLWPVLNVGKDIDNSWNYPPRLGVIVVGAALFSMAGGFVD